MRTQATKQVRALLIGIDRYRRVHDLAGCANDVKHVSAFLKQRLGSRLVEWSLLNEDATKDAIVESIRSHLGQAGPGEVALLWFSGHGSEQTVAPEHWHLEPTGKSQSLVCHDSRDGEVLDLTDKELSVLLDGVAERGPHVVVVLDCCHSGSGTRDPWAKIRSAPAVTAPPRSLPRLPEPRVLTTSARASHVALSACQSHQVAAEQINGNEHRGVFTTALLETMRHLGADATYRDLLVGARSRIEGIRQAQTPVLFPAYRDGPADQPFLGGALVQPAATTVRWTGDRWLVDVGRCHGLPAPAPDAPVHLAVTGHTSLILRVIEVGIGESTVEPLDWKPDPAMQYPVVLSRTPLPAAQVVVGGTPEDDPAACTRVTEAIRTSAYLSAAQLDDPTSGLRMHVTAVQREGREVFRVLRSDRTPIIPDVDGHSDGSAHLVVSKMAHVARWTQIKELANPWSALTGAVRLEIVAAYPGVAVAPREDFPIPISDNGTIALTYHRTADGWAPPEVFVRLRNTTQHRLWCVLLNLTDRYRSHATLFPGGFLAPMAVAAAAEGNRIPVVLPPERTIKPGAASMDWCKLIVSEREINPIALELPALGEQFARGGGPQTVTASLGWEPVRDMTVPSLPGSDWYTSLLPVVTQIPRE
ncbi:caspase family protein [Amycolatopsis sp. NPDC051071]|uniref:caspase family protein n=1 Tax=Amycolatopsis sp. NPDC051071 TaxID=3154637 RepID=UPI0034155755